MAWAGDGSVTDKITLSPTLVSYMADRGLLRECCQQDRVVLTVKNRSEIILYSGIALEISLEMK